MAVKNRESLKPVGNKPGVMYDSCKIHEVSVEYCPPLRPTLSAFNSPTNERAKFLVLIVKLLTANEFTVKDSFHFSEEIVDHQSDFFMGSLDVDSQFTKITLEVTIENCTNEFFK